MPITDLLLEGVNLMFLGMGIVFGFLIVLVFTMLAMSKLADHLGGAGTKDEDELTRTATNNQTVEVTDKDLVAVITAAVARYRMTRN